MINDEPWFVGKDVAKALGYSNARDALLKHVDEEDKGVAKCDTPGGKQEMTLINESGLYALIFGSKLDSAHKFKHWVTSEVLPSLRKNGGYIMNQENMSSEEILANAVLVAQRVIAEKDKLITEMKPKAAFADQVTDSKDAIDIGSFSKIVKDEHIDIGRNKLFEWLRAKKILMSDNVPYQRYIENKWFKVIETTKDTSYGTKCFSKTLITGRGQVQVVEKLREEFCS